MKMLAALGVNGIDYTGNLEHGVVEGIDLGCMEMENGEWLS